MALVLFLIGLVFLIFGAQFLVRGASRLAAVLGISPLVVGLTVVAFGTSSPELAVSIKAALSDQTGIALGNVVGSNIFNVLFILGLSALIVPLVVSQQLIRFDVPLLVALSIVVQAFSLDETISRTEGLTLVAGLVIYISLLIYYSRKESLDVKDEYSGAFGHKNHAGRWYINIVFIIGGLLLLVLGSRWLVDGAISFARYMGVSELVIGLTIVSAGTSLPEVVTSVIAAIRGERDIAVGNVVGSNLFNLMGVLGVAGLISPGGMEVPAAVVRFDIPVMVSVAVVCLPVFFTRNMISRWEGALFLGFYAAYTMYLLLAAAQHDRLPMFSEAMLYFVIPLTVVTLITITVREISQRKNKG